SGSELAGGNITAGAGDDKNRIDQGSKDVLVNYVQNNRVEIYGGSGFDTLVVAGTALADKFYIFKDNEGRQYVYGAGLKLEALEGVERLALVTGAGNDEVWLYAVDPTLSVAISLGSGDDVIHFGGAQETFTVQYPASSAVYTVEQDVWRDVVTGTSITPNSVFFEKKNDLSLAEKQKAWREFYYRWIIPPNGAYLSQIPAQLPDEAAAVNIDAVHWNLLEANLALGLKLFAQGVEKAAFAPIPGNSLWMWPRTWAEWFGSNTRRNAYLTNMDTFEQSLLNSNASGEFRNFDYHAIGSYTYSWFFGLFSRTETIYGTNAYSALLNDTAPDLP